METFVEGVRQLILTIQTIGETTTEAWKEKPRYVVNSAKFHGFFNSAMTPSVDDPTKVERSYSHFSGLFERLYFEHKDDFLRELVDAGGDVNDKWLRSFDPTVQRKGKGMSIQRPKGLVIFLNEEEPKLNNVCIPLTEAYLAAVDYYNKVTDEGGSTDLPAKVLKALYVATRNSLKILGPLEAETMNKRIAELDEMMDSTAASEAAQQKTQTNGPMGMLKGFVNRLIGGENNAFSMDSIKKTVSQFIPPENLGKIEKIVDMAKGRLADTKIDSLDSAVASIGGILKDPEVMSLSKEMLAPVIGNFDAPAVDTGASSSADPSAQD